MDLNNMMCSYKCSIREVMNIIDNNSKGVVFCVDDEKKIVGILTDGDVRRLLLNGFGMNECIENHLNRNFVYAYYDEKPEEIFKKFDDEVIIIPLIDFERKIVDYVEYDKKMHISLAQPQLNGNEYQYLMDAFLSTWISSAGKYVTKFEESFSDYCGMRYGVATSNGTAALHVALLALEIGEGDEVIVPDITFAATINAVLYTGATPVIVDIDEENWCISPEMIEKAITNKTKAIIPVHLYGQPCDMGRICEIAKEHGLYVIEDCAEAHGAEVDGKKVGSFGNISCFSFYGNKVITTGEGGMCLTNDEVLDAKMRKIRDHGMSIDKRYYHDVIGYNYRMTNLQAAIGCAQVEKINSILSWRRSLEEKYRTFFCDMGDVIFQKAEDEKYKKITWLVSVLVPEEKRDEIESKLKENNIDVRTFFYPLHTMNIYEQYAQDSYPISERISKMGLNLPTTVDVDDKCIERIRECICAVK